MHEERINCGAVGQGYDYTYPDIARPALLDNPVQFPPRSVYSYGVVTQD